MWTQFSGLLASLFCFIGIDDHKILALMGIAKGKKPMLNQFFNEIQEGKYNLFWVLHLGIS